MGSPKRFNARLAAPLRVWVSHPRVRPSHPTTLRQISAARSQTGHSVVDSFFLSVEAARPYASAFGPSIGPG
mgnify:FL=1|jgi:hypothetical protein